MEQKITITPEKLADRMTADYNRTKRLASPAVRHELRRLLGRDFVDEALIKAKNNVMAAEGDHWMKCGQCSHCAPHPLSMEGPARKAGEPTGEHGWCRLTGWKVRLQERCLDSKKGGAE